MMGVSPAKALEVLSSFDLAALGANCGNGPHEIEQVIETMHNLNPEILLVAKSNAGIPHWVDEELHYDGTPEVMAEYTKRVYGLGAQLIGGCCGSSPAHIQAMAAAIKEAQPAAATAVATSAKPKQKQGRERRHRRPNRE
ncbi:MAG: homocysteine S-methyltransferase family protein [Anaerolineae bacterium]